MPTSHTQSSRHAHLFSHRFLPHAVLVLGLLLSAWFAHQSFETQRTHIEEEFHGLARERLDSLRFTLAIAQRLNAALIEDYLKK